MKKVFGLSLMACGFSLGMQPALAGADVGSWYVAPQAESLWLDNNRKADDDYGIGFAIGKAVAEHWDLELTLTRSSHASKPGTQKLSLVGYGLDVHRVLYRDQRASPYLVAGLGLLEDKFTGLASRKEFALKYGAGLLVDLAKRADQGEVLQLRTEVGGRRTSNQGTQLSDYYFGLGLQYAWGGAPAAPAKGPVDTDGDGDGDGVVDSQDKCPNTPAGAKVDASGCELDSDGDGVADSQDKCPDTPKGERVDANGCPFAKEIQLEGVYFDTNKADLRPDSQATLEYAVKTLQRYPELVIEVAGHTDSRGDDAHNRKLSQARAESVVQYLKDHGATNKLSAKGYGKDQPVATNSTEAGRQQNRRVALRIMQ
ncbi:MAG: OmpA family protein [Steroidobacteraceae bacterium]